MPLRDATTEKLRTSSVRKYPSRSDEHAALNAQIRGTEDAFRMRREPVLDDA
jgi:hypothetical protein